jgi:molybdopterin molybdotransferase
VVLIAVGDELVEPGTNAPPGFVHEADRYALEAAVHDAGGIPRRVPIVPDDRAVLREALEDQLVRADLVIIAGGLSELAGDTVKDVLAMLGDVRLDQVAMTPGRRQGFGRLGSETDSDRNVPVFALPGHPVATVVSFEVFVRPALRAMSGRATVFRPSVAAEVSRGWTSPAGLRQFVPATVVGDPDVGYEATVLGDPDRPALTDVAAADAFVVVSEAERTVNPGRMLQCMVLEG